VTLQRDSRGRDHEQSLLKRALALLFSRFARVVVLHRVDRRMDGSQANAAVGAPGRCARNDIVIVARSDTECGEVAFVALLSGEEVCRCAVWTAPPHPDADIVPLVNGRFMLGALNTAESKRGKGYASALVEEVVRVMFDRGFTEGVAVVWHSNAPSLAAFGKAGWQVLSRVLLVRPRGARRQIRIERRLGATFSLNWTERHNGQ
jgi:GNAT superfamily N-acetyltransferase